MAGDGSQQRKPDFRTAIEDVKALATVLVMKLESILGRRLKLRSPAVLAAIGVVATLAFALVVVMLLLQAGDANAVSENAALIAALVALGGVFTAQMVSIALDDRRSHEARDLEAQRTREAALQNYFEQVGALLIEQPLLRASPGDNLSTVVRAQTLAVLEGLDPERKRLLLRFLYESGLIYKAKPVVSLDAANLSNAYLIKAYLINAYLIGAELSGANLSGANLSNAELSGANLSGAYLNHANMSNASVIGADLSGARMFDADLSNSYLSDANLSGARMDEANLSRAELSGAELSNAYLRGAYLSNAELSGADLSDAYLSDASLRGADLSNANMQGVRGVTSQELEQQAYFLHGAIMPDGSKHP